MPLDSSEAFRGIFLNTQNEHHKHLHPKHPDPAPEVRLEPSGLLYRCELGAKLGIL